MDKMAREKKIAQLEDLPGLVETTVRGLGEAILDSPFRPGGWTVRQLVHHLADSHMNAFIRFKLAMTEEQPTIKPYNQDEWAKLPDSVGLPVDASLQVLRGVHLRLVKLLRALPDDAWFRTIVHPERGRMSLDDLLEIYSGHGLKHVEHMRKAIEAARLTS
jgi:hypothetical protein